MALFAFCSSFCAVSVGIVQSWNEILPLMQTPSVFISNSYISLLTVWAQVSYKQADPDDSTQEIDIDLYYIYLYQVQFLCQLVYGITALPP